MDMRASHAFGGGGVVVVQKKQRWKVPTEGKIFAALIVVECCSLLALSVISLLYARSSHDDDRTAIEYTSVTAMVSTCALLYFSIDSILLENIYQFAASQVLHALILAYTIWHYVGPGLGHLYDTISLYVMIGVCAFQLAYLILIYPVTQAFGWRLYKKLGSGVAIRPLYTTATIFFTLMKLDFALGCMLVLLAIFYLISVCNLRRGVDPAQIALNVLAMIVTLGWLIIGFQWVMRESRSLAPLFFIFAPLEPAFLLYKLIKMKQSPDDDADAFPVFSWDEFLLTGCVAVVIRTLCIIVGIMCWRNFGKGLKEKMWDAPPDPSAATTRGAVGYLPPDAAHAVDVSSVHADEDLYPSMHTQHSMPAVTVVREQTKDTSLLRTYLQPLL